MHGVYESVPVTHTPSTSSAWVEAPPPFAVRLAEELAGLRTRWWLALPLAMRLARREWRQRATPLALVTPVLLVAAHAAVLAWIFGAHSLLAEPTLTAQRLACGALVYAVFQHGLTRGATVLVDERALVARRAFPLEALLLRPVLAQTIPAATGLFLLCVWIALERGLSWHCAALPVVLVLFVAFTAALATLLACVHARSRSAGELLAWALPLLTLATPVWWDETWIEPNALVQASLTWNPLAAFVGAARAASGLQHPAAAMDLSSTWCALVAWTLAAGVAAVGVLAWRRPYLADEV